MAARGNKEPEWFQMEYICDLEGSHGNYIDFCFCDSTDLFQECSTCMRNLNNWLNRPSLYYRAYLGVNTPCEYYMEDKNNEIHEDTNNSKCHSGKIFTSRVHRKS